MWQKILTIRLTVPPVPFRPQNERKFSASEFLAVNSLGLIPSVLKTFIYYYLLEKYKISYTNGLYLY